MPKMTTIIAFPFPSLSFEVLAKLWHLVEVLTYLKLGHLVSLGCCSEHHPRGAGGLGANTRRRVLGL